jgi:hypothetical protein
MRLRYVSVGIVLVLTVFVATGCVDVLHLLRPPRIAAPQATAGTATTTTARAATTARTTTSTARTTTSTTSTTSTTLSPLESYRGEMRAWRNRYAADLRTGYAVISSMENPLHASKEEIQAAKDLDWSLSNMVRDLRGIQPPPGLSSAHAAYLASLEKLARGVHELAAALEEGKAMRSFTAMATIAAAWQEGATARSTLEQALGFSLSSAD